ncbi:alpha/beta fold hydrolase [Aristaeella lactis]|uniref:Lysophospholipase, alpha-beta hydrolase superfamily n=1 Tax=Aristaeella lactis TaxID=3046383 RepID=A0AC61PPZ7_9FIRM|nr:alpha/beta hydrolase [Aristaeella lactis]QUA54242.1 alpha/beta hydrolase [Aristaeella lactis]SMC88199.1 Lysophospholipase, alpha-beta hydrolase superfamily [Aristaeella lactis]
MSYRIQTLTSRDGYELSLRFYEADAPKAVVKFIHGMEEYQDRYESFAEYLREAGYTVVTADLRGHGKNAPVLSHIADKEGHLRLLEDEEVILDEIHGRWPGMPVILFGHSMGTIIARAFLQKHSEEFHKVVLSGYPNPNGAAGAGIVLTEMIAAVKGGKGYSKMVDGMVLGPFAKAVPNAVTPQDWLSVNRENVQRYIADPLCGVRFTLGSYNALFHLIRMMDSPENYEEVRKDLPILLISGKEDPCTGGEKGRGDSENRLRRAGFRNLEIVTLDGMRHEILNENGREDVYLRILDFIEKE